MRAVRIRETLVRAKAPSPLPLCRRSTKWVRGVWRVQLFAELATHFRALVEFPPEATEGIADEQFVRNVVDVIFRAGTKGKDASAVAKGDAAALV